MVKKSHSLVQIINKLREVEILLNHGANVGEACRKISVTEQTHYWWRKEYGGMRIEQAKWLKELEKGNTRLKQLVADISLDNASNYADGTNLESGIVYEGRSKL